MSARAISISADQSDRPVAIAAVGLSRSFDVSAPWLTRVLERRPRQVVRAVEEVSFTIASGTTLALVGESGCGKSTVAKLLVGLLTPSSGHIEYEGKPTSLATRSKEKRTGDLQMIFQDPYASLNPRWTVGKIIAEPLRTRKLSRGDAVAEVRRLLELVGLSGADADRYPHQFSGGQRQRISIARALASEARVLICDEPTSALDVSVQAQVLNLMARLQRERGLTYLFISHNLAVVRHVSDQVGVMYLGNLVEIGAADEVFLRPRHHYTRMLLDAIPDLEMTGRSRVAVGGEIPNPLAPPSGCAFHPRCPMAQERCRSERPALLEVGDSAQSVVRVACHFPQR